MARKRPQQERTLLVTRALDKKKAAAKGKSYHSKEAREARIAQLDKNWDEQKAGIMDMRDFMTPAQRTRVRIKDAMRAVADGFKAALTPKNESGLKQAGVENESKKSKNPPTMPHEARMEDHDYARRYRNRARVMEVLTPEQLAEFRMGIERTSLDIPNVILNALAEGKNIVPLPDSPAEVAIRHGEGVEALDEQDDQITEPLGSGANYNEEVQRQERVRARSNVRRLD